MKYLILLKRKVTQLSQERFFLVEILWNDIKQISRVEEDKENPWITSGGSSASRDQIVI